MSAPPALQRANDLVAMHRRMAAADFATHGPSLADALFALFELQQQLGQAKAAQASITETVDLCRRLTAVDPATHISQLALALAVAADCAEKPEVGLELISESIGLSRQVAGQDLLRVHVLLTDSLMLFAQLAKRCGRPQESVSAHQEAVALARHMAAQDPDEYQLALVEILVRASGASAEPNLSEQWSAEAVETARLLATKNPQQAGPVLVRVLYLQASKYAAGGQLQPAMAAFAEATWIQRHVPAPLAPQALETPRPPAIEQPFADRVDGIISVSDVVCQLRHRCATDRSAAPALHAWLHRQARLLSESGHGEEAAHCVDEANRLTSAAQQPR